MNHPNIYLYHAKWSLCSQMVRVALYEKGLNFDGEIIKLCDHYEEADNLSDNFLTNVNPTGVVPVLKIDNELVRDSAVIIERIDSIDGNISIKLWPEDKTERNKLRNWVNNTTITEGVPLGKTIGTSIPLFSAGLIENMIKKLSFSAIWKILKKHPRPERKRAFLLMYFFSLKNKIGPIAYKGFVKGILELETALNDKEFLFNDFSHADINLMCCLHRLVDLRMDSILEMDELKNVGYFWEKLKTRKSYKQGIINFSDHDQLLKEAFPDNINPHTDKLKKMIIEKKK